MNRKKWSVLGLQMGHRHFIMKVERLKRSACKLESEMEHRRSIMIGRVEIYPLTKYGLTSL